MAPHGLHDEIQPAVHGLQSPARPGPCLLFQLLFLLITAWHSVPQSLKIAETLNELCHFLPLCFFEAIPGTPDQLPQVLRTDKPSLVLLDSVETSLHPGIPP